VGALGGVGATYGGKISEGMLGSGECFIGLGFLLPPPPFDGAPPRRGLSGTGLAVPVPGLPQPAAPTDIVLIGASLPQPEEVNIPDGSAFVMPELSP